MLPYLKEQVNHSLSQDTALAGILMIMWFKPTQLFLQMRVLRYIKFECPKIYCQFNKLLSYEPVLQQMFKSTLSKNLKCEQRIMYIHIQVLYIHIYSLESGTKYTALY